MPSYAMQVHMMGAWVDIIFTPGATAGSTEVQYVVWKKLPIEGTKLTPVSGNFTIKGDLLKAFRAIIGADGVLLAPVDAKFTVDGSKLVGVHTDVRLDGFNIVALRKIIDDLEFIDSDSTDDRELYYLIKAYLDNIQPK